MPSEKDIRRDALVIKLNHVLLHEGISAPTMSSLAKSIGISRASLYLYFKNKEDIVEAAVSRHLTFISLNPVPTTFNPKRFPKVLLDSLLLLGSTTDIFLTQLHQLFPRLWEKLDSASNAHFEQWTKYAKEAQRAHYLINDANPDFMFFHMRASVRSILSSTTKREISPATAETYLLAFVTVLLRGITTEPDTALAQLANLEPYERRILTEFRETYA